MYLKYYCLSKPPFGVTPDPAFLFLSESHKEALASLLYGIEKRKGFICVTGEVGCGKTTVLKSLLSRVDPDLVKTVYLYNPELSFDNLIRAVFEELELGPPKEDVAASVRQLHASLIDLYQQGKHVLMVVDEAQRMPVDTIERLRILSNLETAHDKLLQIVLCGQPELEELMARPQLRQLRERIAVRSVIRPLNRAESFDYVQHRLKRVAYGTTPVFAPDALKRVVRHAKGNPRLINILCDNALVAGYAEQKKPVTAGVVKEAIDGLTPANRPARLWKPVVAACGAAAVVAAATLAALGLCMRPAREQALPSVSAATNIETVLAAPPPAPIAAPEHAPAKIENSPQLTPFIKLMPQFAMASIQPPAPAQAPRVQPEALPTADPTTPGTETVKPGDTLSRLLARVYGRASQDLLQRTLQANPGISDANKILAGDTIVLPDRPL